MWPRRVYGSRHPLDDEAVIETRLPEMDTFACTMALHRLARCSHDVDNHVQNGRMVRPEAVNPTRTSLSQREQRLWRASLSASVKQHPSFTVLLARLGNADALKQAWPDLHCFSSVVVKDGLELTTSLNSQTLKTSAGAKSPTNPKPKPKGAAAPTGQRVLGPGAAARSRGPSPPSDRRHALRWSRGPRPGIPSVCSLIMV